MLSSFNRVTFGVARVFIWAAAGVSTALATADNARAGTLSTVQTDFDTRQGLLATGLLHTRLHRATKQELRDALELFRDIYQDGQTEAEDVEVSLLRSFSSELQQRFGIERHRAHIGRHILVPRTLLANENSRDKTQSFYRAKDSKAQLYTYRWRVQRNPPQEMLNQIFFRARKGTILSLRHSSHEFAIRARAIRQYRGGTEYIRHQVQHAFIVGGYLVGAYFTYTDDPSSAFVAPSYMAPQVAYWRRSVAQFTNPVQQERAQEIRKWVKNSGLTDLHADDLIALGPIDPANPPQQLDALFKRWVWRQSMAGLAQSILKPFQDDNRLNTVDITKCHRTRGDNKKYREVRILFGTNRKYTGTTPGTEAADETRGDPREWFAQEAENANILNIGCAMISVPQKEEALVALKTSFQSGWHGFTSEVPKDDANLFRVTRAQHLRKIHSNATRYRLRLRDTESWKFTDENRALVFVHGYNTSFEYALLSAAQIAASINYPGRVYLFSWPSAASFRAYVSDMDSAERSEFHLAGFLRAVFSDPELQKLDIIVHSMGSQMLLRSLSDLGDIFYSRHDVRLGQVIFAAPDVSESVFTDKVRDLGHLADRITVYSSENDKALQLSQFLRRQGNRIGLMVGDALPRLTNVDYFDATSSGNVCNLWGWYGIEHSYFTVNPVVRQHMSTVLTKGLQKTSRYADVLKRVRKVGIRRYKIDLPTEPCRVRTWNGQLMEQIDAAWASTR